MLADDIEAGGGSDEAVALALGWHRRLKLEEVTPEDCDRDEHVSYREVPWWYGPNGERKQYLPPAFLTDLNALAAECERRGWRATGTVGAGHKVVGHCYILSRDDTPANSPFFKGNATTPARALCAALVRAVEAGNGH